MIEADHLELQEYSQESITRPKLKRMILEYLQKRSRKEILLEEPIDEESGSLEQRLQDAAQALEISKYTPK